MEFTIRQLFESRLPTFERLVPISPAHSKLKGRLCEEEKYLLDAMSAEGKERFSEYLDMWGKLIEMSNADAFAYEFKLAARMLAECFESGAGDEYWLYFSNLIGLIGYQTCAVQ
jgi:hypothetical protein